MCFHGLSDTIIDVNNHLYIYLVRFRIILLRTTEIHYIIELREYVKSIINKNLFTNYMFLKKVFSNLSSINLSS